ncbi:hypothetical protein [Novosphingobium gossypii]|uniref:hypothetical protein n=1 Tax=Novosphingobium gossypii TaxID=1604774 RepID=UPI003D1A963E
MTRASSILILAAFTAFLFGFDAWSTAYLDTHPAAREFFASRAFTLALIFGGTMAVSVASIIIAALALYPEPSSGRAEPEDHV